MTELDESNDDNAPVATDRSTSDAAETPPTLGRSSTTADLDVIDPELARELGIAVEEPRLLEPDEIRARRRPRAVLFVWAWELACALLLAIPVHAWAKGVWGSHPHGDAVLFRSGGHELLTWLSEEGPGLAIVVRATVLMLVVFGVLGQIVTGALVAFLATGTGRRGNAPPVSFALRAGGGAFASLLGITVLFGAIEGLLIGIGLFASSAVDRFLQIRIGDARSLMARLVVFALFVVLALVIGVFADLARVTAARNVAASSERPVSTPRAMRDAIASAMSTARRSLGRASLAWGWRATLSIALVYAGALAGDSIGSRGGGALWLLFIGHQLIVLARAGLRASWLANALRLVAP